MDRPSPEFARAYHSNHWLSHKVVKERRRRIKLRRYSPSRKRRTTPTRRSRRRIRQGAKDLPPRNKETRKAREIWLIIRDCRSLSLRRKEFKYQTCQSQPRNTRRAKEKSQMPKICRRANRVLLWQLPNGEPSNPCKAPLKMTQTTRFQAELPSSSSQSARASTTTTKAVASTIVRLSTRLQESPSTSTKALYRG